jgi:hypothetical protein
MIIIVIIIIIIIIIVIIIFTIIIIIKGDGLAAMATGDEGLFDSLRTILFTYPYPYTPYLYTPYQLIKNIVSIIKGSDWQLWLPRMRGY